MKLIVTDVDGTLVPDGSMRLDGRYFELIRELDRREIRFAVASGRHSTNLKKMFAPVKGIVWFLSQNGSVAEHSGSCVVPDPVPADWVAELWEEIGRSGDAGIILYTANRCYVPAENTELYDLLVRQYRYDVMTLRRGDRIPPDEIYTMMTIYHPADADGWCREHLSPHWRERMQVLKAGQIWVDLVHPANGKGRAVRQLADRLRIGADDVTVFGDNLNDLSMFAAAGTAIAVENADPAVREAAHKVIAGYREDGVLRELEEMLRKL